jgi:hypothetical protein
MTQHEAALTVETEEKTVPTTIHVYPSLMKAVKKRGIDLGLNVTESIERAMRQWLAPPRIVNYRSCTPDEQLLLDGVLQMFRDPLHTGDRAVVQWVLSTIKSRIGT